MDETMNLEVDAAHWFGEPFPDLEVRWWLPAMAAGVDSPKEEPQAA